MSRELKQFLTNLPKPIRWIIFTLGARPARKISFLALKASTYASKFSAKTFHRSVKLMSLLSRGQFTIRHLDQGDSRIKMSRYYTDLSSRILKYQQQPKISILLPVYKVPLEFFAETLACVESQIYENWELCIVDDASGDDGLQHMIRRFADRFPHKVKIKTHDKNQHISATSNSCLDLATGDFVALFDHDDRIYPNALAEFVRSCNASPESDIFYSDERAVGENGEQSSHPFYKPGWSPELHLQVNYTTHFSFYRTAKLKEIGGFRVGLEGSQDHDVMLRMVERSTSPVIHIPVCLYEWRIHANSTASNISAKPYAVTSGIRCVSESIERKGRKADVEYNSRTFHYDIKYQIKGTPKVSIIIPSKNNPEIISTCLSSVFERSSYKNLEVIVVDNGSTDPKCEELYKSWTNARATEFRTYTLNEPFNFARLNNFGVQKSTGDYVVLLNNDTEVISADWIQSLLQYAQFPEIGAVGAQLRYPDGTIQHAGGVLLGSNIGGHIGRGLDPENRMYIDFIQTSHECSFVTAACLMIEKSKYETIGGLDEINVPNGYGDVDFGLKLRKRGLSNIYSHAAVLTHFESKTRGRSIETFERQYMLNQWGKELNCDPYLNPNLRFGEFFEPRGDIDLAEPNEDFILEYLSPFIAKIK